jgi:hypothetical protein
LACHAWEPLFDGADLYGPAPDVTDCCVWCGMIRQRDGNKFRYRNRRRKTWTTSPGTCRGPRR